MVNHYSVMSEARIIIIGAGVVGLSVASKLSESFSDIIVVEKNQNFGQETSSRNSEVIHAGLYYPPGSLKAKTCIKGNSLLYEFCKRAKIPHRRIGKLVVAFDQPGAGKIRKIFDNAISCGVDNLQFLTSTEVKKLEPKIKVQEGFFSPDTGILDTHSLMRALYVKAKTKGVTFAYSSQVIAVEKVNSLYKVKVKEGCGDIFTLKTPFLINAAGLYADKVAQMAGIDIDKYSYVLNYCRGQYFRIGNPKKFNLSHLIYPPPTKTDLGIHITPDLSGGVRLGPDAKYIENIDYNIYPEDRIYFQNSLKRFLPNLEAGDLIADTVGVRPKLQKEKDDFRDFVVSEETKKGLPGLINLIGIESPGLTACFSLADIIEGFLKKLDK